MGEELAVATGEEQHHTIPWLDLSGMGRMVYRPTVVPSGLPACAPS